MQPEEENERVQLVHLSTELWCIPLQDAIRTEKIWELLTADATEFARDLEQNVGWIQASNRILQTVMLEQALSR